MPKIAIANYLTTSQVIVLKLATIVCFLLLIDSYLIPSRSKLESIKNLNSYKSSPKGLSRMYSLQTEKQKISIPAILYLEGHVGDSVVIRSSVVSGVVQRISNVNCVGICDYEIGFMRAGWGNILVPLNIIGLLFFLFYSDSIEEDYTRNNVFAFLIFAPLALLVFHFDLQLFIG